MNKYNKIANELIEIIGENNIISITHCATRLRVMVKDREIINDKKVEKVNEVKGVFFTSGQYQIILGTGIVNKVYAEVEKMGLKTLSKKEQDELVKNNETGFKKVMRTLADLMIMYLDYLECLLQIFHCIFRHLFRFLQKQHLLFYQQLLYGQHLRYLEEHLLLDLLLDLC